MLFRLLWVRILLLWTKVNHYFLSLGKKNGHLSENGSTQILYIVNEKDQVLLY